MINYVICEILGKQYKVIPNQPTEINYQREVGKGVETSVLLLVEDGKLKIGKPYLKDKLTLKVMENIKGRKIRVSKFHAKANYRRVKGSRQKLTKVVWDVKKAKY